MNFAGDWNLDVNRAENSAETCITFIEYRLCQFIYIGMFPDWCHVGKDGTFT